MKEEVVKKLVYEDENEYKEKDKEKEVNIVNRDEAKKGSNFLNENFQLNKPLTSINPIL